MSKFTPLSEIDSSLCQLPLPNGFDEGSIGVHLGRIRSIAALGGFIAEQTRIISASGETSSEAVGVAGASGDSAFGTLTGTASKANTADSESQQHYVFDGHDSTRLPGPLTLKLNSSEIAQRTQRKSPIVRDPKPWASQIDRSLRLEMTKAIWRDTFTAPTFSEGTISFIASLLLGTEPLLPNAPTTPAAVALGYCLGLNFTRLTAAIKNHVRPQEAHFSLAPFFHVDRAAAATARLACSRLVKAL